jgi:hypothetical protein
VLSPVHPGRPRPRRLRALAVFPEPGRLAAAIDILDGHLMLHGFTTPAAITASKALDAVTRDRPAEPEPPEQVGPVRADSGLCFPGRQQVPEELSCAVHHRTVRINDLIRLVPVPRGHETALLSHRQRRQVPLRISLFDHERRTYRQEQLFTR